MPHRNRKLEEQVKVAKKYKVDKPSMLHELRYGGAGLGIARMDKTHSDAWYKYQYYKPTDGKADVFGFVHFESKKEFNAYKKAEREYKRGEVKAPSTLSWILLLILGILLGASMVLFFS